MIVAADLPRLTQRRAFDYFTTPKLLIQWWPQEAEVNARPGGHFALRWPSMNWELSGLYTVFEPGARLAFTWQWLHQPELPSRVVDVAFEPAAEGCRVAVIHGTYSDSAVEREDRQGHIDGWIHFLGRLQQLT
jgi:uncharacterized protein YndB with AHSA1/START domain